MLRYACASHMRRAAIVLCTTSTDNLTTTLPSAHSLSISLDSRRKLWRVRELRTKSQIPLCSLVRSFEPVCDQLRTSFEPASVMEFGFNSLTVTHTSHSSSRSRCNSAKRINLQLICERCSVSFNRLFGAPVDLSQ